jgi:hypothetical protein
MAYVIEGKMWVYPSPPGAKAMQAPVTIGPFETYEAAFKWGAQKSGLTHWSVGPMTHPDELATK